MSEAPALHEFVIRPATPDDRPHLVAMLEACGRWEGAVFISGRRS